MSQAIHRVGETAPRRICLLRARRGGMDRASPSGTDAGRGRTLSTRERPLGRASRPRVLGPGPVCVGPETRARPKKDPRRRSGRDRAGDLPCVLGGRPLADRPVCGADPEAAGWAATAPTRTNSRSNAWESDRSKSCVACRSRSAARCRDETKPRIRRSARSSPARKESTERPRSLEWAGVGSVARGVRSETRDTSRSASSSTAVGPFNAGDLPASRL